MEVAGTWIKKAVSAAFFLLILFVCISCGEENKEDKDDSGQQAQPLVFSSKTLQRADKIKGVYFAEFNFDFSLILGAVNEVLNVFKASNSHKRLKISINHSGRDEEKQIIVAIETRNPESDDIIEKEIDRLCALFDGVDYRLSENKTNKAHFFGKIRSKGGIGDAKYILALEVSDIQGSNIDCDGDEGKICIYMGPNSYDKSSAKPLTGLKLSELESLQSFNELKKQCGF